MITLTAAVALALTASSPALAGDSDGLQQALRTLDNLALLDSLNLEAEQIKKLIPSANAARMEVRRYNDLKVARARQNAELWREARATLMAGDDLSEELSKKTQEAWRAEDTADEEYQRRVARIVAAMKKTFYPRQNALIAWQPEAQRAKDAQTKNREATNELALRALAAQTIEAVRNLPMHQYFFQRLRVAEDFLTPIVPPGSPRYQELYPIVLDIFRRAKEADDNQYLRIRDALAVELLDRTGLTQAAPIRVHKPITFEMLVAVFTDPETPEILQDMLKARSSSTTETTP